VFDRRSLSPAQRLALAAAVTLAGCQSLSEPFGSDAQPSARSSAYGAALASRNGSAASASIRIAARDDGVAVTIAASGLTPGRYSVVFHANGNCSSPNAFSAGPPWAPPGVEPARLWLSSTTEGYTELSTRVRGYKLDGPDGLLGKAVVLHAGSGTLDAQPGVANDRVACGVIGPMHAFF
jgi:Cu-Zn family superoxide dismutase